LPDTIVIGVRKAGTRAILEFLRIHPQVTAAKREPHFFDRRENYYKDYDARRRDDEYEVNYEWYKNKMQPALKNQVTMEKTPRYFIVNRAPRLIKSMDKYRRQSCSEEDKQNKKNFQCRPVKLILVIRDPVDRLISDFTQIAEKRADANLTELDFEKTVFDKNGRLNEHYPGVKTSMYDHHMTKWQNYGKNQLFIANGTELKETPWCTIQKLESFLGLDKKITENNFVKGERGYYCIRNNSSESTPRCLAKSKGRKHVHVTEETKKKLRKLYTPYNEKFYKNERVQWDFNWPEA